MPSSKLKSLLDRHYPDDDEFLVALDQFILDKSNSEEDRLLALDAVDEVLNVKDRDIPNTSDDLEFYESDAGIGNATQF